MGDVVHLPIVSVLVPRRRGDCEPGGPAHLRPCPWRECRWHIARVHDGAYSEERAAGPHIALDMWDEDEHTGQAPPPSCVLDVCDDDGASLDDVGLVLGLTRERARQIEAKAIAKLERKASIKGPAGADARAWFEHVGRPDRANRNRSSGASSLRKRMAAPAPILEVDEDPIDEGGEERRWVPRLPHVLDETVSDEQYAGAIYRILVDRDASRATQGIHVRGAWLAPLAYRCLQEIERTWAELGRGPTGLEIADALGLEGATDDSRRTNASNLVASLREAGLVEGTGKSMRPTVAAPEIPEDPASEVVVGGAEASQQEETAMPTTEQMETTNQARLQVVQLLRKNGPMAPRDLIEATGVSQASMSRIGASLRDDGTIESTGLRSATRWAIKGDKRIGATPDTEKPEPTPRARRAPPVKMAWAKDPEPAPSTAIVPAAAAPQLLAPGAEGESMAVRVLRRERDALLVQVAQLDSAINKLTA